MTKLKLPSVTLIAVAGNKQGETLSAMYKSMAKVEFAACKLITNVDLKIDGIECINVGLDSIIDGQLKSWHSYNKFIIKNLYKYFDTTHCLIVQHDSWVLDAAVWTDEFLEYDLIGARGLSDGRPNYNGGFSLRSHRFQKAIAEDDFISITAPEDEVLCRLYRSYIEKTYDFKYCTDEVADKFAYEMHEALAPTFGFHNFHWPHFRETIVFKRDCALGDIIMLEPVMEHFYKKGYQIALDTQQQYYGVFSQHYFPIVPKHHLNPKLPYREINMDMAYEIKPKQPVLQSYYEMAGVHDGEMRNSRLSLRSGNGQKMFSKYAILHINKTDMGHRNIHNLQWKPIVDFLKEKGYLVFQIGTNEAEAVATPFNTMSLEFMMFFISGADIMIASDSGPVHVAVGFGVPSVIFFGSVNPANRFVNFDKIRIMQSSCPKEETKHCYHNTIGVRGQDCIYDIDAPPCTVYHHETVIEKIKELI